MEPVGIVVIGVLVVSIVVGLYFSRQPPPWDEIGGETPPDPAKAGPVPTIRDDEDDLRALVAEKRARRLAGAGPPVASDRLHPTGAADGSTTAGPQAAPWAHLDDDVVEEARGLVARRRARLERSGKPVPDGQAELERLLGPPHR